MLWKVIIVAKLLTYVVKPPSHLQEIVEEENAMFLESLQQGKAETVHILI